MDTTTKLEKITTVQLVLIEASKLSLEDEFMNYEPKNYEERRFKDDLITIIKKGVKDFWTTKYDPSFYADGTKICFLEGKKPATGKSFEWWKKNAKNISYLNKSKMGKVSEYKALMGVLIKSLVEIGWSKDEAWYSVCCDPKKLLEYIKEVNSKDYTEIKEVFKLCNLGTTKVVSDDHNQFAVIASKYGTRYRDSLINMQYETGYQNLYDCCTGWVTFNTRS